MIASMGSTIDAARAAADKEIRAREAEERQARFRAWWNGLSPEAQRAEIKAGHVRVNLPSGPDKPERTPAQMKAERRRARGKR